MGIVHICFLMFSIKAYIDNGMYDVVKNVYEKLGGAGFAVGGDPLDGTDASRIAQCLGLDPEQYRRQVASASGADGLGHHDDENQIKDEDRFRQCTKFEVACNCGEVIVLDGITRGSGKDLQLALQTCPNLSCQRRPLAEKFVMIKNKLILNVAFKHPPTKLNGRGP